MSWDEHIMLIAHTVNSFGSAVQVIGNTGSNATREAVHATEQGFSVGMAAALQINPYYGKTSQTGLLRHFRCVPLPSHVAHGAKDLGGGAGRKGVEYEAAESRLQIAILQLCRSRGD